MSSVPTLSNLHAAAQHLFCLSFFSTQYTDQVVRADSQSSILFSCSQQREHHFNSPQRAHLMLLPATYGVRMFSATAGRGYLCCRRNWSPMHPDTAATIALPSSPLDNVFHLQEAPPTKMVVLPPPENKTKLQTRQKYFTGRIQSESYNIDYSNDSIQSWDFQVTGEDQSHSSQL